jgi:hypothetical protein
VKHYSVAGTTQDGSAQEYLHAQAGGLAIAAQARGTLELAQQVEEHQNAQEGRFGGEELLQTEIIRRQVGLQLPMRCSTQAR